MIAVHYKNGEWVDCEDEDAVREVVLEARELGPDYVITSIHECTLSGEEIPGGQVYAIVDWDVKIRAAGAPKETVKFPDHALEFERGADGIWRISGGFIRIRCSRCQNINCELRCQPDLEETAWRDRTNAAFSAIESVILAHQTAGLNILTRLYVDGVTDAVSKLYNDKPKEEPVTS